MSLPEAISKTYPSHHAAVQRNRVIAARTFGKGVAGEHGSGTEVLGVAVCEAEAHSATLRDIKRGLEVLVDAKMVFNYLADRVEEPDVFTFRIAPAFVQFVRNEENGALLFKSLEAVLWGTFGVERVHVSEKGHEAIVGLVGRIVESF
jgi:hypothetical protein